MYKTEASITRRAAISYQRITSAQGTIAIHVGRVRSVPADAITKLTSTTEIPRPRICTTAIGFADGTISAFGSTERSASVILRSWNASKKTSQTAKETKWKVFNR